MDNERILKVMRLMAWSRAQGELYSMLTTYYGGPPGDKLHEVIDTFIKKIEDEGLCE